MRELMPKNNLVGVGEDQDVVKKRDRSKEIISERSTNMDERGSIVQVKMLIFKCDRIFVVVREKYKNTYQGEK